MPRTYPPRSDGRDRRDYYRDYYQKNKERLSALRKGKGPEYRAGEHYQRRYGVTPEWYDEQLARQGGVCAICGRPPKKNRLHIDHNHETGEVRGILCTRCNTALAHLEEPTWLDSALKYLTTYERNTDVR